MVKENVSKDLSLSQFRSIHPPKEGLFYILKGYKESD